MSHTPPNQPQTSLHAQLHWDEQGQPLSSQFGDVYFSRANGLEETRHVFLRHNQLPERWAQLAPASQFTIAETGFGSGLNFLAAWQLWLHSAPADAQLHFVSVEKYPLNRADLSRALALWPELAALSQQLIDAYPCITGEGFYRLNFMDGRIKLTLIINDASQGFRQLLGAADPRFAHCCAKVDAWFLDGFAPAKNPQMWSHELFECIRLLSQAGTTAATFSAAGIVKQGLKHAGFQIEKVAGFGRKREMVKALLANTTSAPAIDEGFRSYSPYPAPWAVDGTNQGAAADKQILIIGGGLAGCTSARALAERGWRVTLVERQGQLAQEGSGNPQGVLYAKLSPKNETQAAFNLSCLEFALGFYQPHWFEIGEQCGVLQLAHDLAEQQLQQQLRERFGQAAELVSFVDATQASALAGVKLHHGGLFFPRAGWINPPRLCARLVDHPLIQVHYHQSALRLAQMADGWQVASDTQEWHSPRVIIANARYAQAFSQTADLPIKAIRGQISYLPANASSNLLKTVVCGEGYIAPAHNGQHCVGATFNLKDEDPQLRSKDHHTNLHNLANTLPELASQWQAMALEQLDGRVAFRCTLPDYLPLVGPVPDTAPMLQDFALLRRNARAWLAKPGSYLPGLYLNIGHGSRGLAYCPLSAELLAGMINNEPLPMARELDNALNPARFLIRDLIKNRR